LWNFIRKREIKPRVYLTIPTRSLPRRHPLRNQSLHRSLKNTFCTNDLSLLTGHSLDGLPHRDGQGLERGLSAVVVVVALQHVDVQGHAGGLAEAMQTVRDHLGGQRADLGVLEAELAHEVRSRRDVDHGTRDRLVERRVRVAEPSQALAVAEGAGEGLAEP
jgi:hypothetical protein